MTDLVPTEQGKEVAEMLRQHSRVLAQAIRMTADTKADEVKRQFGVMVAELQSKADSVIAEAESERAANHARAAEIEADGERMARQAEGYTAYCLGHKQSIDAANQEYNSGTAALDAETVARAEMPPEAHVDAYEALEKAISDAKAA